MQAAKEANIEPLRLVTSCMAASVCLRYHHILRAQDNAPDEVHDDDHKEELTNHHDDGIHGNHTMDMGNSPYNPDGHNHNMNGGKNGFYDYHNGHNGHSHQSHNHHDHHHKEHRKRKKRKKRKSKKSVKSRSRCYLVADLSNIGCSLSIIECKQKRHSDIVKVHFCSGSTNDGLWRMINAFSLFVVRQFVDGYNGYYRPQSNGLQSDGHFNNHSNGYSENADPNRQRSDHHHQQQHSNGKHYDRAPKRMAFYDSISRYDYKHDMFVYDELQRIESIETTENTANTQSNGNHNGLGGQLHLTNSINDTLNNEALKCRFRSQMLCDTIIEHLHDQYRDDEVQIHYQRFYRSFSLQLILTAQRLQEIALDPFLFSLTNCIDKIVQEFDGDIRIDECLLVGDGGNIPAVQSLFGEYFEMNGDTAMQSASVVCYANVYLQYDCA